MHFPLTLRLGAFELSAHALFELAAYAIGFALLALARRRRADELAADARWTLNTAAILGAVVGSKLVHWAGDPAALAAHAGELSAWIGGKSIVGGLLGGTLAVEFVKRRLGITARTGDVLVLPLVVSIAVGRVGCFLEGAADDTCGVATSLPWGVDFGDGVARHPAQLYEIVFLALLVFVLARRGARFDAFLLAYLGFRFAIDFWKPYERVPGGVGLAATQWACVLGIAWRVLWIRRQERRLATGALR